MSEFVCAAFAYWIYSVLLRILNGLTVFSLHTIGLCDCMRLDRLQVSNLQTCVVLTPSTDGNFFVSPEEVQCGSLD